MHKGETDAAVAQGQRNALAAGEGLALKEDADQDGQRRVGEQDQAFKAGRNVLQAPEVENARAVLAKTAEQEEPPPVAARQAGAGPLLDQTDPQEDR